MQPPGFRDLVQRAQTGDRLAMDELLPILRPWLEQAARGYADAHEPAASTSDLVQEVWLQAWQKLGQFRGAADDEQTLAMFRAWVGRIVRRLGLNVVRHRQAKRRKPQQKLLRLRVPASGEPSNRVPDVEPAASEPSPSANLRSEERARLIREALDRIPDDTNRTIIRLCFFDGLWLRQIAERLDLGQEQVRQRYHVTMRRLQHELGELL